MAYLTWLAERSDAGLSVQAPHFFGHPQKCPVKNPNLGLGVPYRYGSETRREDPKEKAHFKKMIGAASKIEGNLN
jgi:hypothetical protein